MKVFSFSYMLEGSSSHDFIFWGTYHFQYISDIFLRKIRWSKTSSSVFNWSVFLRELSFVGAGISTNDHPAPFQLVYHFEPACALNGYAAFWGPRCYRIVVPEGICGKIHFLRTLMFFTYTLTAKILSPVKIKELVKCSEIHTYLWRTEHQTGEYLESSCASEV